MRSSQMLFTGILVLLMLWLPGSSQGLMEKEMVLVTGMVVSGENLSPLPNAHIWCVSGRQRTISDRNGFFAISACRNDVYIVSYMGLKKMRFSLPDSLTASHYSVFLVLEQDTLTLSEAVIHAWPSTWQEFRKEFLDNLEEGLQEVAIENMDQEEMVIRMNQVTFDAEMNFNFTMEKIWRENYYAGQTDPITVLDPFAWYAFFKALKDGSLKDPLKK